ncbi:bystin [Plasmopara halstedii]|uniref:Bystin n=1 Tax=Plasmopara halstedii TaxID=4781 RepID=A0A0P1AX69_PLAHL|nr:bystin [Plasmopara halstedii]CEG46240.1 bystin [Plasmopara halstedii]|eukprot:XP_024582609.1 bystin [Plasmopara halstedii]
MPKTEKGKPKHDDMTEDVVPEKLSRRTLALAKQQQAEEEDQHKEISTVSRKQEQDSSDESADENDEDMDDYDSQDLVRFNGDYVEDVEICEEDEEALANFMMGAPDRRNLADIIMNKIFEKEARERGDDQAPQNSKFDPKIVEVYTGVGRILQRYTSGKLPKAFKVIPSLSYWEDILWLTSPEKWSPHAMRAATRLFASNLNPKMAQRFYNIFLLEHVRQDIHDNKRLNFHLYMALKKALYKPQAFFKGIIIPLCESKNCSQREAAIIGSVLSKVSVPVIHSAATLMKLSSMEYSGGNSMFIRVLLNKKYSLPTRVVSELSQHFLRFTSDTRKLPVLWHQSLLVFAQRYKNDIPKQYKEAMKPLLKQHFHHQITPEIRREIFNE